MKNAYLLAKIGADTAENERHFAENLPNIGNYPTGPLPYGPPQSVARLEIASAARRGEAHVPATLAAPTAAWLQGKLRKLVT